MQSMIITPNPDDPEVKLLTEEFNKRGYEVHYFIPSTIKVKVNINKFEERFIDLEPRRMLVRGFGANVTQKIFFRLDILRAIEEYGIRLINSRESLEIASDKFLTSVFLEKHNIPTPKTIICEDPHDALKMYKELGGDVIIKPLFGSKGIGISRLSDQGFAENVIISLGHLNEVFYLQEFIEHYNRDIRIFVIGDKAIAGMYRVSDNWKTNVYAGAEVKPLELTKELKELAIKSAKVTKTEIAGVDILESKKGYYVIEVNSIPGFMALQKVTDINIPEQIITYFLNNVKV
ncbi:MAG: RimK family alpha-L-glutamate ligase [Promethearchaeota archaeon]|nr:MAG: RimK family alpha-L-glutamate ligase [Candidatus Lokiarchaeota archaeon]